MSDFRDIVVAMERQFLAAYQRGDAAATGQGYTEDAWYLVPGQAPVHGRAAIVEVNARDIASGLKLTRLTAFHNEASGNLGYALETYSSSAGDGVAMLTYRRGGDGVWRISAEAFLSA